PACIQDSAFFLLQPAAFPCQTIPLSDLQRYILLQENGSAENARRSSPGVMDVSHLYTQIRLPQEIESMLQNPSVFSKSPCRLPAGFHLDGRDVWYNPSALSVPCTASAESQTFHAPYKTYH